MSRKTLMKFGINIPLVCNLAKQTMPITLQLIQIDDFLQLTRICHCIRIYHLYRRFTCTDYAAKIIDNHIVVEHRWVNTKALLGKTIVVVPRLHVGNKLICRQLYQPQFTIILYHLSQFQFAESQHHIKSRIHRDIRGNIIAA